MEHFLCLKLCLGLDKIKFLTLIFALQLCSSLEKGQLYIFRVGSGQVRSINVSKYWVYIDNTFQSPSSSLEKSVSP